MDAKNPFSSSDIHSEHYDLSSKNKSQMSSNNKRRKTQYAWHNKKGHE